MTDYKYIGTELEIFGRANHWKAYYKQFIAPNLQKDVLEVGAGIGLTTLVFVDLNWVSWTCLEPDPQLVVSLENVIRELNRQQPDRHQVINGKTNDLNPDKKYDSIVYIDVLEHIEDDRAEIERAYNHLADNGYLIVLSPAHKILFSAFDQQIGHFRRYNKKTLGQLIPPQLICSKLIYLDSAGSVLSLGNKLLLHNQMPTPEQIAFWDNVVIPISKYTDKLTRYKIGKSILGIWKKG